MGGLVEIEGLGDAAVDVVEVDEEEVEWAWLDLTLKDLLCFFVGTSTPPVDDEEEYAVVIDVTTVSSSFFASLVSKLKSMLGVGASVGRTNGGLAKTQWGKTNSVAIPISEAMLLVITTKRETELICRLIEWI